MPNVFRNLITFVKCIKISSYFCQMYQDIKLIHGNSNLISQHTYLDKVTRIMRLGSWSIHLEQAVQKLYKTNLSNIANLWETICWGPWMAASSQYSLMCWSIILKTLTILMMIIASKKDKIIVVLKLYRTCTKVILLLLARKKKSHYQFINAFI